ncbi:hypothetical protein BC830DRAFT_261466 [Chytriomyces sp. MP71]|nr:hypothetical protein BC830DRAFT_261466 [Chytriomyces sp. MP71]
MALLSGTRKADLYRVLAPFLLFLLSPILLLIESFLNLRHRIPAFSAKDKVILITGASAGIGQNLALQYARRGAKLVLLARRRAELDRVADACKGYGAALVVVEPVDVTDEGALQDAIRRNGDRFGCIDMIILNAGISMGDVAASFPDTTAFRQIMAVNYTAFVAGALYALPYLKKASRGKLVGISSALGLAGLPTRSGYSASKFAIKGFLDAFRIEEPGLDMSMIYPGPVKTEINKSRIGNMGHLDMNAKGLMTAEEAAELIVHAVELGLRDEVFELQGNALWFLKDVFPRVRDMIGAAQFTKILEEDKKE